MYGKEFVAQQPDLVSTNSQAPSESKEAYIHDLIAIAVTNRKQSVESLLSNTQSRPTRHLGRRRLLLVGSTGHNRVRRPCTLRSLLQA